MTKTEPHLSVEALEGRYKAADETIAENHFHAVGLLASGRSVDEVAELPSFSTRWVKALIKRYNEGGPERLGDQRANNGTEPTSLTPQALSALRQRIKTPPVDGVRRKFASTRVSACAIAFRAAWRLMAIVVRCVMSRRRLTSYQLTAALAFSSRARRPSQIDRRKPPSQAMACPQT
jgi:hypothetical protein